MQGVLAGKAVVAYKTRIYMLAWDQFCLSFQAIAPVCLSSLSATTFCFHWGIAWGAPLFPAWAVGAAPIWKVLTSQCISPLAHVFHENLSFVSSAISCTCLIWFEVPNLYVPSQPCWSIRMSMAVPIMFVDIILPSLCWHEIELCGRCCLSFCLPRLPRAVSSLGRNCAGRWWYLLIIAFLRATFASVLHMQFICLISVKLSHGSTVHVSVDMRLSKVASGVLLDCAEALLDICALGTLFHPSTVVVRHIQGLFVVTA